jgi:Ca2+-binding RTX toxin-like protein
VSFGRTTLDTFAYAAPNAVADASVSTANAALLASLSIDGIRLSDAVIGDYVTANVVGRGTDIGDYFSGAARQDHLQGLAGSDTLVGFDGADTLLGGADHDRLDGGSGNDSLLGGTGNDVYSATQDDIIVERANEGFDAVWVVGGTSYVIPAHVEMMLFAPGQPLIATGNALANTMVGNENANILQGFGSGDQIDGGAGADTLVGGLGRDTLHGGTGADHFRFDAVTHSDTLFPDLIVDFTFTAIERDRINLAVIDANTALAGNQGFTFIGANAFTGAAGELRATPTAGLGYAVAGDTNGDRAADFVINVVSAATPSSGWFIL